MTFEGFPRTLDDRELGLVENLVQESYNDITLGPNVAITGCLDPLAREMQSISVVNQTINKALEASILEVLFEATVSCDRCDPLSPLFSEEQLASQEDNSQAGNDTSINTVNNETEAGDIPQVNNVSTTQALNGAATDDPNQQILPNDRLRRLQGISFDSQEFFQKLIQLVIFETEELADDGELPEGFEKVSKAWVITEEEEDVLVTEVQYERRDPANGTTGGTGDGGSTSTGGSGGSGSNTQGVFQFAFVDEEGEVQKVTVEVTEEGEAVPTTEFPTLQPSHQPSDVPSSAPTNLFSGQPTTDPSQSPSKIPSVSPSMVPSGVPSVVPSDSPSDVPSTMPSDSPSAGKCCWKYLF
mmetsp:Transcript_31356/g.75534  ORF Transcript_31356/g.75534 Transcript_31356/m.75534 type:complete len:356 (+) Transcript_31356:1405-2472(+)